MVSHSHSLFKPHSLPDAEKAGEPARLLEGTFFLEGAVDVLTHDRGRIWVG